MSRGNDELSQGARANYSGQAFEDMLTSMFERYGFDILSWREWRDSGIPLEDLGKVAIKQFPYTSIYDHVGRTEWLIVNNYKDVLVRIEIKTQRSAGSVDEKLPYMYLNAVYAYPENDVILLVDGDGFKPGAKQWLRDVVNSRWLLGKNDPKNILMMSYFEFADYFIKELS